MRTSAGVPRSSLAMTALKAPRDLNEFESCTDSSLSDTSAPARSDSHAERTSGVRRTYGAIRRRAHNTSRRVIGLASSPRRSGLPRENLRQLLRERRAGEHFSDASLSGGVDDVDLHGRGEPQ